MKRRPAPVPEPVGLEQRLADACAEDWLSADELADAVAPAAVEHAFIVASRRHRRAWLDATAGTDPATVRPPRFHWRNPR